MTEPNQPVRSHVLGEKLGKLFGAPEWCFWTALGLTVTGVLARPHPAARYLFFAAWALFCISFLLARFFERFSWPVAILGNVIVCVAIACLLSLLWRFGPRAGETARSNPGGQPPTHEEPRLLLGKPTTKPPVTANDMTFLMCETLPL